MKGDHYEWAGFLNCPKIRDYKGLQLVGGKSRPRADAADGVDGIGDERAVKEPPLPLVTSEANAQNR